LFTAKLLIAAGGKEKERGWFLFIEETIVGSHFILDRAIAILEYFQLLVPTMISISKVLVKLANAEGKCATLL
jgi:hypothetical protein